MDQMTADEILEAIYNMENDERWKFLEKMYDEFYNPDKLSKDKPEDLKLDIAFIRHKLLELEKGLEALKQK